LKIPTANGELSLFTDFYYWRVAGGSWQEVRPEFVYTDLTIARITLTEEDEKEFKVLEKRIASRVGEHQIGFEDF
jgi:hypothetical protein